MKKMTFLLFAIIINNLSAQTITPPAHPIPPIIKENLVRAELQFLSSEWFEGRKTGERGNDMAADYLGLYFQEIGLAPFQHKRFPKAAPEYSGGENESFFQDVPMFRYTVSTDDPLTVITHTSAGDSRIQFKNGNDFGFYYGPTSSNVAIKAPIVFAGYGISMPDKGYDDFSGIDITGKTALISMGYPGYMDASSAGFRKMQENKINEYSRWDKFAAAKKKGAAAVLFLYTTVDWNDPTGGDYHNYTYRGENKPETEEPSFEIVGDTLAGEVPVLTISRRLGVELFKGTGLDLSQFDSRAASECKPASTLLKDKMIELTISKKSELIHSNNIIGCLPGENPDKYVIVGAHYDHLGKTKENIYFGADDNASGAVAVMQIARACMEMKTKPKCTILFALWTGEEEGLLGSTYFMDKWNNGTIDACFNFDMISRYNPRDSANFLRITLPKGLITLRESIVKINREDSLGLRIVYAFEDKDEYGGSDYAPFAQKGIPFCWFFTGFHPDYHQKTDTYYKGNMRAMARIINLGFTAVWQKANLAE